MKAFKHNERQALRKYSEATLRLTFVRHPKLNVEHTNDTRAYLQLDRNINNLN